MKPQKMKPLDWQLNTQYADAESHLGRLPSFIDGVSTAKTWEQITKHTSWEPFLPGSWELTADDYLIYASLPPLAPAAMAYHLGEKILVYPHGFVCIVQLNQDYTVARIDI